MSKTTNPVNWFEIPATNIERAKTFYENVFGTNLDISEMGPYKMAFFPWDHQAAGCPGALVMGENYTPSHQGSTVYFSVDNIDECLAKVKTANGKVLQEKTSIGEHGAIAHFEDTEGNRVSLHSK
ncbi:MAG TPA: VOC family protein [Oligoflexia bacterium]|nr:VOC family protein [Oligoflexia bacterium]HMR25331.1 VOC family protein [Oligoflexia bacterium]